MKKEILNKKANNILNDKTSGSVELLIKLNDLIKNIYDDKKAVNDIIGSVKVRLNEFQIINTYLKIVRKLNNDGNRSKLKSFLNKYVNDISNQNEIIYGKVKKLIKGKNSILTLSNSNTVFEVLKRYSKENNRLKIFICESRPKNEGRILAKSFIREGMKCELNFRSHASPIYYKN